MFPNNAPCANPVFSRTYSRLKLDNTRENWQDTCERITHGIAELGKLTDAEKKLLYSNALALKSLPSGRWLWVGGTDWVKVPKNFYGAYNCSSSNLDTLKAFELIMNLTMQGCGTGAVIEPRYIEKLPPILNTISVKVTGKFGSSKIRTERTFVKAVGDRKYLFLVGDSREGWCDSYLSILQLATDNLLVGDGAIEVEIDISGIRQQGEKLKGFGGIANPTLLPQLYPRIVKILNGAVGRKLNSAECCLLIDEPSLVIVSGNVRRSAGIRQFSDNDPDSYKLKEHLWKVDSQGVWTIDPDKDALRMANHTRVFHKKPTLVECIEAVRSQYYSGEGAIQYAPEAIARGNVDLLDTNEKKVEFLRLYNSNPTDAKEYLRSLDSSDDDVDYRMNIYGLNPCGEIILQDNLCNLSEVHLSQIDPFDIEEQKSAFKAASLWACSLLHHEFVDEKLKKSRELDPIVGVGMTGVFDFFVKLFGVDWLHWWKAGRTSKWGETKTGVYLSDTFYDVEVRYLKTWRKFVENDVANYCKRHNLKIPNRCTTVKPSGTQSLLSNSSPGWHPPKGTWYIRRITFARDNPVALACIDYGYTVIPSQSNRDESGNLLDDPYDPRCTEWLIEIPVSAPWATLDGVADIEVGKFSGLAQFDFMMQIQKHYVGHNTSSTLEFTEAEIEPLGNAIYQAIQDDEGYISAALLARFESKQTFPRMPFEPISKETYEVLSEGVNQRRSVNTFEDALKKYDTTDLPNVLVACETDKCLI